MIFFLKLEKRKRNNILNGFVSKHPNTNAFIKESDFFNEFIQTGWALYSTYAHSDYLPTIQINGYLNNEDEMESVMNTNLLRVKSVIGSLIYDLRNRFYNDFNDVPVDNKVISFLKNYNSK